MVIFYGKKVKNATKDKNKNIKETKEIPKKNTRIEMTSIVLMIMVWILSVLIVVQGLMYSKMLMELSIKLEDKNKMVENNHIEGKDYTDSDKLIEEENLDEEVINENDNDNDKETNENSDKSEENETFAYIGKLSIPDININESPIYEGTDQKVLSKGIGHFTNTNICNGNIGLASHNAGR